MQVRRWIVVGCERTALPAVEGGEAARSQHPGDVTSVSPLGNTARFGDEVAIPNTWTGRGAQDVDLTDQIPGLRVTPHVSQSRVRS